MHLEFNEKLSYLQTPDRNMMTDEEFKVFEKSAEKMMENNGFISNLLKVLPLNASQYIGFLNFKNSLFNNKCYLSDTDKEMMGVVISATNACANGVIIHGENLRSLTGDPAWVDQISYNYKVVKMTKKQRALCDYAYFITAFPREIDNQQVDNLREAGFNDNEILEAAFIAGYFNYTNRWISAIGLAPNEELFYRNRDKK